MCQYQLRHSIVVVMRMCGVFFLVVVFLVVVVPTTTSTQGTQRDERTAQLDLRSVVSSEKLDTMMTTLLDDEAMFRSRISTTTEHYHPPTLADSSVDPR